MPFKNPDFATNARLRLAAENSPAMSRGEKDEEAVSILQQALIGVGAATMRRSIRSDGTLDGEFGSETVKAVRRFQEMAGLASKGGGDGIAGRKTLAALDERAPYPPVSPGLVAGPKVIPRAETTKTTESVSLVKLPTASDMLREYKKFRELKGKPCTPRWRGPIRNQCAIRMTVSLGRVDIGFHLNSAHLKVHSGRKCGVDTPHDASASRVFRHLRSIWNFQHFRKTGPGAMSAAQIHGRVLGKKGIVYFEDCFSSKSPDVGGDHIDFWDGSLMMNDRLDYNGPGERAPNEIGNSDRFFKSSKRNIWFLPIPE